jgi:hypothetical protein
MPIPLLIWAAAAGGAAYVAWKKKDAIASYLESENGKTLLTSVNRTLEGINAPYKRICEEVVSLPPTKRRRVLLDYRDNLLDAGEWAALRAMATIMQREDPIYTVVKIEIESLS